MVVKSCDTSHHNRHVYSAVAYPSIKVLPSRSLRNIPGQHRNGEKGATSRQGVYCSIAQPGCRLRSGLGLEAGESHSIGGGHFVEPALLGSDVRNESA